MLAVLVSLMMTGPAAAEPGGQSEPAPDVVANVPCRPGPEHPRPVILVHGTWADKNATWGALMPALREAGYCVFALDYGRRPPGSRQNFLNLAGGGDIAASARTLARFVEQVRRDTGARQVDMVGHSQGALVVRQYLKFEGGADAAVPSRNNVHTLVSLAGTNHGTTFKLNQLIGAIGERIGIPVRTLASLTVGPSYIEQMVGSPFLRRLNDGGDTLPGVRYVAIGSRDDTMITPAERTFLRAGPGATVRNIWIQDECPGATVSHMGITSDPRAVWLVRSALDPDNPPAPPATCR